MTLVGRVEEYLSHIQSRKLALSHMYEWPVPQESQEKDDART